MNRKVAARAVFLTSIVVGLAVAGIVLAVFLDKRSVALGIAGGSGVAFLCGVSWVLGALLTFHGPMDRLLKATLGLAPVRFFVALGGVLGLAYYARDSVNLVALGLSFIITHFLLQLMEA